MIFFKTVCIMAEIISYKICAVKVRNAKLRNYLKGKCHNCQVMGLIMPETAQREMQPVQV
jgi:hypothetical protein